jgi:predicted outer membrane repeat protein
MKNPLPFTPFKNIGAQLGLLLVVVLLLLISPAYATIRYVDATRANDSGSGLSWATAHKYLQTALAAAQPGDQIWVAEGTYKPTTSTTDRTISFVMKENVKIYGGFTKGQIHLTDRNINPATNNTILSGDINNDNALTGNSYHVVLNDGNGLTAAAVLDGFTLTGGNAEVLLSYPGNSGGGMFNRSSSPTLTNCSFLNNTAAYAGGGMSNSTSYPLLTNCSFINNSADAGGGISNIIFTPTLINCSFVNNSATSGGGIADYSNYNPSLTNCSFLNNTASLRGGALFSSSLSPKLVNCVLFGNGGQNTIVSQYTVTATYCLFEASETDYTSSPSNLITTVSPFVSTTSAELRPGSLAIDAGNNAAYNGPATDLASNPRMIGTIDIGAYEFLGIGPYTRYVDATRLTDSGDGLSWTTAHKHLQTALAAAQPGDQVWVAQGTYKPTTSTTNRSVAFVMKENVKIYGGFTSGQTALSQRNSNPATNNTVLSGDIENDNTLAGNSFNIIYNDKNGLTAAAVLDGFTVAYANGGGGMVNINSSPTLANCSFLDNSNPRSFGGDLISYGGGMANDSSSPSLTNCSFVNNSADNGGGMANYSNSSPSLTNCSFLNNSSENGGGIHNSYFSSPSLTNCSFLNNSAIGGGGIYNRDDCSPSLTNCSFVNNSANAGGGMANSNSSPTLANCSFLNNSADYYGGGIYNNNNYSLSLTNCSFLNNPSDYGGGIYNLSSSTTLTNCSFLNNTAVSLGGGMYSYNSSSSLANCALFNNGEQNTLVNESNSTITANYSLFEASETDYIDNGNNLTTTVSPFVSTTSAELRLCSPAIDAGDDSANGTVTDLAGNPRKVWAIDIGAYEFQANPNTFQRTWTGSMNGNWNEPGNWSPAFVPTACDKVFINTSPNDPVIGTTVNSGMITLNSGVTLTIQSGATLHMHCNGTLPCSINMYGGNTAGGGILNYVP